MRSFALIIVCLGFFVSAGIRADADINQRPNVIVILTDDQGWGDLSIHGNTAISTPNIDQLANDGAQFDRFYVCPVCSPTRAEFLTGRNHVRCGVYSTSEGGERVNPDEVMIGEVFKDAGYKTAAFGKWHSGMQFPYHPNARGFDEFYGFCSGHWGNYYSPMLEHNGELVRGEGFIVDDFTSRAMEFVEENRDEPFFVYLPYNTPHSPMQVPDRWWNKFKDKELTQDHAKKRGEKVDHTRAALAMCENIDWNVGRLLQHLEDLQLAENTIVVYFCDNGPNGNRWNGGMKGRKGSTDEGGVRSPLFIRWPAKIKVGTRVPQICCAMDLLPSLAELASVTVPDSLDLDGVSIARLVDNPNDEWEDRTLVQHWKGKVSVRTQQHRLDHEGKLFDMVQDPGQLAPVSGQLSPISGQGASVHEELTSVANRFREEMLVGYGPEFDKRPFVIGHPDSIRTQIPARDGTGNGNIKRSNRWPNDSYFTNWKSADDSISWDCEVGQSGVYQVDLL
ncbi:MAG: arylsulfatase [Planctomycetota bacterium]